MSPLFTIELARQRQQELLASAPRHHRGDPTLRRLSVAIGHAAAALRADIGRMQLGRVETACQTC